MQDIEDLDDQDLIVLGSLVNPDEINEEKYVWDVVVQQRILGSMLRDRFFLMQSLDLIKPQYFVESIHSRICKILFDYFEKYKSVPNKEYIELLIKEDVKADNPILPYYIAELNAATEMYEPGLENREFLLDKITEFAKVQATREATSEMITVLKRRPPNRWSLIRDIWQKALQVERNVDVGLEYFQTVEDRYARMEDESKNDERFITGFESIDQALSGGLSRGEIGSFAGMSGSGKSICLIRAATRNIVRGKRVLYISLEMGEDKIAQRFDSMLTRIGLSDLKEQKDQVIHTLNEKYFADAEDRKRLVIKQFAASSADTNSVRAYMSQLSLYGFIPDLIVVDYVGEMRDYPNIKTYESRERHVRELRSFAKEFNVAVLTAMQINRSGREAMEKGHADDDNLADSAGQVRPLDALWILCQNEHQKKAAVGSIFVAKHRNGKSRYSLFYRQMENTLDMIEISAQRFKEELNKVEDKIKEQVEILDIAAKTFKPNRKFNQEQETE